MHDNNFPSDNYIIFKEPKATQWDINQRLPKSNVAYCGSIESALVLLFQQLIVENCKDRNYKQTLKDLSYAIDKTKKQISKMLTPKL